MRRFTKASNGKLIAHKSMLPYASYRIRLFKTILSALTLNQFNETDIEFAGKKSIKQQGKNVDVYAISVPSENATVYVDMEKFKILALKKIMFKNPDRALFVSFSDFKLKKGLRFPEKWSIFDEKNRDCGYITVKEIKCSANINKDWFSERSIEKSVFTLCSVSWEGEKDLHSAKRKGLLNGKMMVQAAVDITKKVYVVDDATRKRLDALSSKYKNKFNEIDSKRHLKTIEKNKKKDQLFKDAFEELKSITKNLERKTKLSKKAAKLYKRSEEVSNNWKKPEWQEKQYKMKMREGINKTEAQYVLTEKARHELKKLEAESTEKLKRALKDWPDEFKKIQHEIMEVFIFFDRELKRIQKNLEKKEKPNEEKNNE